MGNSFADCCVSSRDDANSLADDVQETIARHERHRAAQMKLMAVWEQISSASKKRPYSQLEWSTSDSSLVGMTSAISNGSCASQSIAFLVRAEWFDSSYSGLFRQADFGLAQLSVVRPIKSKKKFGHFFSAAPSRLMKVLPEFLRSEDVESAAMTPCLAVKFFRGGNVPSGNLLCVGQPAFEEQSVLSQCLCSEVAEVQGDDGNGTPRKVCGGSLWLCSFGLSAFAEFSQDGKPATSKGGHVAFPWALILKPSVHTLPPPTGTDAASRALSRMLALPAGTALYEVFACPSPGSAFEAGWLQPIGRLVTASDFVPLSSVDPSRFRLQFRQQPKEEDYQLRPDWLKELLPSHKNCGSQHFDRLLERRYRQLAARGGAWTAETLPCTRWTWTRVTQDHSSDALVQKSKSHQSALTASLRQRGGRCVVVHDADLVSSNDDEFKSSSSFQFEDQSELAGCSTCLSPLQLLGPALAAYLLLLFLWPDDVQRAESPEQIPVVTVVPCLFTLLVLLLLMLRYYTLDTWKRHGKDNQQLHRLEGDISLRNEPLGRFAQELSRPRMLVRGNSAHELLLI